MAPPGSAGYNGTANLISAFNGVNSAGGEFCFERSDGVLALLRKYGHS